MVNPQNISDDYIFVDPVRLIKYEFISYEELSDLSQYRTGIDANNVEECFKYGFTSEYSTYTKYRKVINEDGTLNTIENITKERLLDGVYGEIVREDENHSYRPVKITVRISNSTQVSQEIKVFDSWGISLQKLITMDDGNLYLYESLYNEIADLTKAINEKVTVERVRKAAENSIPTRQAKFEKEAGDPEAFPVNPNAYKKAADKLYAAKKMTNLPKGDNRDYAKLRKAARKVRMDRDEQAEDAWAYSTKHSPETDRLDDRSNKADLFAIDSKGKMR
jgi:hypothetical protein